MKLHNLTEHLLKVCIELMYKTTYGAPWQINETMFEAEDMQIKAKAPLEDRWVAKVIPGRYVSDGVYMRFESDNGFTAQCALIRGSEVVYLDAHFDTEEQANDGLESLKLLAKIRAKK